MSQYLLNPFISLFKIEYEEHLPRNAYCINKENGKLLKIGPGIYNFLLKNLEGHSNITFAQHEDLLKRSLEEKLLIQKDKTLAKIIKENNAPLSFLLHHIKKIHFKDYSKKEKKENLARYSMVPLEEVEKFGNFKSYAGSNSYQILMKDSSISLEIQDIIKTTFLKCGETFWEVPHLGKGHRRTSPSNGGRHPIELYLLSHNNDGVHDAIYHFSSLDEKLTLIASEKIDYQLNELLSASNKSSFYCFYYVSSFPRSQLRYNESRSLLSIFLDCGHLIGTIGLLTDYYNLKHINASYSPHAFQKITKLSPAYEGVIHATIISKNFENKKNYKNNYEYSKIQPPKNILIPQDFVIWEQAGWIGAIYIYAIYTTLLNQLFAAEIIVPAKIAISKNHLITNPKKYLYRRTTYRKFEKNHQLTNYTIKNFILNTLPRFHLENIRLIIIIKNENDQNNGFYEYNFIDKKLHLISKDFPLPYLKKEFQGQLNCTNFLVSFHFFYTPSNIYDHLIHIDLHILLTLVKIGNISQNLIIKGMSLDLGSFVSHASRTLKPFAKIKIISNTSVLLYSLVMGPVPKNDNS